MATISRSATLGSAMSGKERLAAALRCREVDRVPWAPKVFIGHYRSGVAPEHRSKSIAAFAELLNCDAMAWDSLVETVVKDVTSERIDTPDGRVTITTTPVGALRCRHGWSPESHTHHILEHPLKSPDDYKIAQYIAENTTYRPIPGRHAEVVKATGDRGVVISYGPGTPMMDLLQFRVGMPQTYFHRRDYPEAFQALYEAEADAFIRYYQAYAETDAEYILPHENTSSILLSPEMYREYCLPLKQRLCRIVKRAGKICILHMCGTLKGLLPLVKEVGADGWESFTPPPIGDVFFSDGRRIAGDGVSLTGGMNAVMLTQWPEARLLNYVDATLDRLPHTRGVIFNSGGAMPIECPLDKLSRLGQTLIPHLTR